MDPGFHVSNNVAEFELGFLCFVFVFGGFNLGGWIWGKDQIPVGDIIAIISTLLYSSCACCWLSRWGLLGI